jgi:hypothetical protein
VTSTTGNTGTTTRRKSSESEALQPGAQAKRRFLLLVLLIGCLVIALQAARLGLSGAYSQLAHREAAAGNARLESARDAVHESLRYSEANPAALNLSGTLRVAKIRSSTSAHEAVASANEARSFFVKGLQLQPTSPFLWSNLALSKLYLDELDLEMLTAVRNADALGPWEPLVQEATVFIGLAAWHKLDAAMRASVTRSVERAGLRNADRMFAVVRSYGRQDLACKLESYRRRAAAQCGAAVSATRR